MLGLLKASSESMPVPFPSNPAPILDGVVREDFLGKVCLAPSPTERDPSLRNVSGRICRSRPNPRKVKTAVSSSIMFVVPFPIL